MWESRLPPDDRNRIPLGLRPLIVRGDRDADHRRGLRRQDGREERGHLRPRPRLPPRSRAGRGRAHGRRHRHRAWPATCTSITWAASPRRTDGRPPGAALSAGALCRPSAGVGRRHPSARAQPGQLPAENFVPLQDAGVLTLVDDGAEIMPGVTLSPQRRPHRASPGGDDRVRRGARRSSPPTCIRPRRTSRIRG